MPASDHLRAVSKVEAGLEVAYESPSEFLPVGRCVVGWVGDVSFFDAFVTKITYIKVRAVVSDANRCATRRPPQPRLELSPNLPDFASFSLSGTDLAEMSETRYTDSQNL